jgi:putative transposase
LIQKYNPRMVSSKKRKVLEYVIDETIIKVGSELIWLWVAIEIESKEIIGISISKEQKYVCCY